MFRSLNSLETVNNNVDSDWNALFNGKSLNPWANMFRGVRACWNSYQDCVHAALVSCDININLSCWITEASSWTPSCHATMWTECDHPLAREPDWAKGISHRHANSTNAPVRPKWQMPSATGFSCLFLHVCVTSPWEKERGLQLLLPSLHCLEIAEHLLLMWCGSLATASETPKLGGV